MEGEGGGGVSSEKNDCFKGGRNVKSISKLRGVMPHKK